MTEDKRQYYITECARISGCDASYVAIKSKVDAVINSLLKKYMYNRSAGTETSKIDTIPSISKDDCWILHEMIHDDDDQMSSLAVEMVIASISGIYVTEIQHRTTVRCQFYEWEPQEDTLQDLLAKTIDYIRAKYDPAKGAKYSTILKKNIYCWLIELSVDALQRAKMITVDTNIFRLVMQAISTCAANGNDTPNVNDVYDAVKQCCATSCRPMPMRKTIERAYIDYYRVITLSSDDPDYYTAASDDTDDMLDDNDDAVEAANKIQRFLDLLRREAPRSEIVRSYIDTVLHHLDAMRNDTEHMITKDDLLEETCAALKYGSLKRQRVTAEINALIAETQYSYPVANDEKAENTAEWLANLETLW